MYKDNLRGWIVLLSSDIEGCPPGLQHKTQSPMQPTYKSLEHEEPSLSRGIALTVPAPENGHYRWYGVANIRGRFSKAV